MEFYKAVTSCTPIGFETSADAGGLFGSRGFLDFTISGEGKSSWGIEVLQEANNLAEHIDQFSPGGRYSSLGLTEACLVDFRCCSIDDELLERVTADMNLCAEQTKNSPFSVKLFVVCYMYNDQMETVEVVDSTLNINAVAGKNVASL